MRQCSHRNKRGTQCRRSAADGVETCVRHDPASKRAPLSLADQPPQEASERGDAQREASTSAAERVLDERGVELHRAEWRQLAERARELGGVDAVIVDAPYSERTHAGHDDGVDGSGQDMYRGRASKRTAACGRKPLSYSSWGVEEVRAFVAEWSPLTRGWFATLTDHVLAREWERALEDAGRYVFAPIACVESGSRVRLQGDGPPNWSVWLVVARPSCLPWNQWATIEARAQRSAPPIDGAYVVPPGEHQVRTGRRDGVVGGKPVWLMRAIVRDYTRPGDLVADPCAGAGTLGVACIAEGRRALLGDRDAAHVEIARKRLLSCPGEQKRLTWEPERPALREQVGFNNEEDERCA